MPWGKTIAGRGGSGVRLDNVSKYDNYSQYASPAATATANGRNTLDGNQFTEESLLELLNNTNHEIQDSTNYTTNNNGDDYYAEESLLQLLNNDNYNEGMALSPSAPQREEPPLPAEESLLGLLHKESATESSRPLSQITHKDTQKELHNLQLQLELESTEEAVLKCLDVWKSARDRSDHGTIPAVRKALMSWYGPLTEAIELEQWLYLNGDNKTSSTLNYATVDEDVDNDADDNDDDDDALAAALAAVSGEGGGGVSPKGVSTKKDTRVKDRTIYGPLLCLLPPQKIAVLLAHSAFSCAVADGDVGSKVVSLAIYIANALETEVNVSRALRVRAIEKSKRSKMMSGVGGAVDDDDDGGFTGENDDPGVVEDSPQGKFDVGVNSKWENVAVDEWVYTATHLQRFLDELSGSGNPGEKKSLASQGRVKPDMVRKRCQEILYSEGFFPRQGNDSTASTANDVLLQRPISMNEFVDWDPVLKVKLGAALIRLLLDHTTFSNQSKNRRGASLDPAFLYSRRKTSGNMKFSGFITIHPDLLHLALREELSPNSSFISPRTMQNTRCQPMVVPPKKWMDVNDGGYETLKVDFMRTRQCKVQKVSQCLHIRGVYLQGTNATLTTAAE